MYLIFFCGVFSIILDYFGFFLATRPSWVKFFSDGP